MPRGADPRIEYEPQILTRCPYCGGRRLIATYRDVPDQLRMSPGTWQWVRCERCGSLLLSPRPPGEALAAFYPHEYTAAPGETATTGPAAVHALEDLLFALQSRGQARIVLRLTGLKRVRPVRLLDVGCGSGRHLEQFRRLGLTVRGWTSGRKPSTPSVGTASPPTSPRQSLSPTSSSRRPLTWSRRSRRSSTPTTSGARSRRSAPSCARAAAWRSRSRSRRAPTSACSATAGARSRRRRATRPSRARAASRRCSGRGGSTTCARRPTR